MNRLYDLTIKLWLKSPLLSSGGSNALRGVDRTFYRDSNGNAALQRSHIKGKLREAMQDLQQIGVLNGFSIKDWFGDKPYDENPEDDNFKPNRAKLRFSDFLLTLPSGKFERDTAIRISIDPKTGTSKEHFLQVNELLTAPLAETTWNGHVYFWAESEQVAEGIRKNLLLGFQWINALGGMKGSGYGRLIKVESDLKASETTSVSITNTHRKFHLCLTFEDDLFIGGSVNTGNYRESETVIPGAVIKGSLARFLNESSGSISEAAIDASNRPVANRFQHLSAHFWQIHFSHAFPSQQQQNKRATVIPFSAVEDSNNYHYDVALENDANVDKYGKAIKFPVDWKGINVLKKQFGWAACKKVSKTRTAIRPETRTADEEKLYTFQYITPDEAGSGDKVCWIANITLPDIAANTMTLADELMDAISAGWQVIGKRDSFFKFELKPGHATPTVSNLSKQLIRDGKVIVTLQSDALLFNAYVEKDDFDLKHIYNEYWKMATDQTCQLDCFFARQKMAGRYYGMRFTAHANGNYYPFVLTEAGSVFVLNVSDTSKAPAALLTLLETGLPVPASNRKDVADDQLWKICPFVPENGFGEIAINLDWHWNKQFSNSKEAKND